MPVLIRLLRRIAYLLIAAAVIWFIITQLFDRLDQRIPVFAAAIATYLVSAYIVLPLVIRASIRLLRSERLVCATHAADGMAADPVNIILTGTESQLRAAFAAIGWTAADPLTAGSAVRMIISFVLDRPYPAAPFSALYLFGRRQDLGFQEDIGNSPRRRHHVRFWASELDPGRRLDDPGFWTARGDGGAPATIWIGAATTDTGLGFQSLTYQVSHRVDRNCDRERDHIASALLGAGLIEAGRDLQAPVLSGVPFTTDRRIFCAKLVTPVATEAASALPHRAAGAVPASRA